MMTSSNGNIFRVTDHLCGGIHRSPGNSPHKCQWRGALIFSLICVWINGWVNSREAGDLRPYRAHYDIIGAWWPTPLLHCAMFTWTQIKYRTVCMDSFVICKQIEWNPSTENELVSLQHRVCAFPQHDDKALFCPKWENTSRITHWDLIAHILGWVVIGSCNGLSLAEHQVLHESMQSSCQSDAGEQKCQWN